MTIIQKFFILAALLGFLSLSTVESNNAEPQPVLGTCCSVCQFQGMGTPQCERCLETC